MTSNILLLASKTCFLTSQGLVNAGMNGRALDIHNFCWPQYVYPATNFVTFLATCIVHFSMSTTVGIIIQHLYKI